MKFEGCTVQGQFPSPCLDRYYLWPDSWNLVNNLESIGSVQKIVLSISLSVIIPSKRQTKDLLSSCCFCIWDIPQTLLCHESYASLTGIGPSSSVNYPQATRVKLTRMEPVIDYLVAFTKLLQRPATRMLGSHSINLDLDLGATWH